MPVRDTVTLALRAALAAACFSAAAWAADPAPSAGFRYWDPADTAAVPRTLSATGLYAAAPGKDAALAPGAWHYEVNAPHWSDGAGKRRWVILKPGRSIGFREKDDYWDYPDSTVFVEEIAIDTVPGDTASRVLWETRILVCKKAPYDESGRLHDRWYGFSYEWRPDQKDADLVNLTRGKYDSIRIWPDGAGAGKSPYMKKWQYPGIYLCERCHQSGASDAMRPRSIQGFFTAQLNREAPDSAGLNQIDWLFAKGVLRGQRPPVWDYAPRWRGLGDSSASLDLRARSYLAANCSGCHGGRGASVGAAIGTYLDFDFHDMAPRMEFRHYRLEYAWGRDTVPPFFYAKNDAANPLHLDSLRIAAALVVPGYPGKSVLPYRMGLRDTVPGGYDVAQGQMPPMSSYEADTRALALLEEWIRKMPEPAAGLSRSGGGSTGGISIQGRLLRIDPGFAKGDAGPILTSVDGRKIALRRLAAGLYEVPAGLPKGLYLIRAGSARALRLLP